MKNYKIIELSNGTKHIILDTIICNNEIYTLTKEIKNEKEINNTSDISKYDEKNNMFVEISQEIYNKIKEIFINKQTEKNEIENKLKKIIQNLQPYKIIKKDKYNYTLKNEIEINKNIEFLEKNNLEINDTIYISERIIKEQNPLVYGQIYNKEKITESEIIKIETKNNYYYLQRYYG